MNKILVLIGACLLGTFGGRASAQEDGDLKRKIDSLFVIASSGEVKYRDMNGPAMDSIAALGAPAVPYLVDKFTTKSARERWTIIWTLQRIGSAAVPYLVESLGRPDPLVVERVCWALGDIKDSAATGPLMAVADNPRWQVRDQAVGALGKIGSKRADDVVMRALSDTIGQVRKSAVVSCGQLAVFEAIPNLVHVLGDDFYGARLMADISLFKLDTATVIETLVDSLNTDNDVTGAQICYMLGRYATDTAFAILRNAALNSRNPERRAHAAVAIILADPDNTRGYREEILNAQDDRWTRLKVESAIYTARHVQKEPTQ